MVFTQGTYREIKEEAGSQIAELVDAAIADGDSSARQIAEEMIAEGYEGKSQQSLAAHIARMRRGLPYGIPSVISAVTRPINIETTAQVLAHIKVPEDNSAIEIMRRDPRFTYGSN